MPAAHISDRVAICYQAFQRLLEVLRQDVDLPSETTDAVQRQFDRFKMWVGNIGAHRKGQSSLDFRLRDASHVSQAVVSILDRLHDLMTEAYDVLLGGAETLDHDDESESEIELDGFEPMSVSETIDNVLSFIADTIKALLRISMAIRNPAPQDRYKAAKTIDTTFYESFDIEHIRSLYRESTPSGFLIERLGRANTSRRQFLKYSEAHRERLGAGLPDTPYADSKSTVATSIPSDMKLPQADFTYESISYTPSIASATTINTTAPGREHMQVVPFPAEANYHEEFECPLCRCIITIRDWNHWKSHQFHDLQPYVCIVQDCIIGSRTYGSRREWQAHVEQHGAESTSSEEPLPCPMCKRACRRTEYIDHLTREMQQLALFVVPSELFDSSTHLDGQESTEDESDESNALLLALQRERDSLQSQFQAITKYRITNPRHTDVAEAEVEGLRARIRNLTARITGLLGTGGLPESEAQAVSKETGSEEKDYLVPTPIIGSYDNNESTDELFEAERRLKALSEQTEEAQKEHSSLRQALMDTADEMIAARDAGEPRTVAQAKMAILREKLAQGVTGNQLVELRQRIEHSASQHGYLNDANIDPAALDRWQKDLEEALEADTAATFAEMNEAVASIPVARSAARIPLDETSSEDMQRGSLADRESVREAAEGIRAANEELNIFGPNTDLASSVIEKQQRRELGERAEAAVRRLSRSKWEEGDIISAPEDDVQDANAREYFDAANEAYLRLLEANVARMSQSNADKATIAQDAEPDSTSNQAEALPSDVANTMRDIPDLHKLAAMEFGRSGNAALRQQKVKNAEAAQNDEEHDRAATGDIFLGHRGELAVDGDTNEAVAAEQAPSARKQYGEPGEHTARARDANRYDGLSPASSHEPAAVVGRSREQRAQEEGSQTDMPATERARGKATASDQGNTSRAPYQTTEELSARIQEVERQLRELGVTAGILEQVREASRLEDHVPKAFQR